MVAPRGQLDDASTPPTRTATPTGAETLVAERTALLAEVSAATGRGGRARHIGGSTERARVTVRDRDCHRHDHDSRSQRQPPPVDPHPDRLQMQLRAGRRQPSTWQL
jgi:hypothetical protein